MLTRRRFLFAVGASVLVTPLAGAAQEGAKLARAAAQQLKVEVVARPIPPSLLARADQVVE